MIYAKTVSLRDSHAQAFRGSVLFDVVGIAGLMALGALIRFPLPFSPVPVTMQTLVVLLAGFLVGPRRACGGMGLYMALGCFGVPLFAVNMATTGGYLLAFLGAPWLVGLFRRPLSGMIAATCFILFSGAAWLSLVVGMSMSQAFMLGVAPFVPGGIAKIIAAKLLLSSLDRASGFGKP